MRVLLKLLAVLVVLGGVAAALLMMDYHQWQATPVHEDDEGRYVDIASGSSFRAVLDRLEGADLLGQRRWYFEFMARQREQAGRIHAGEYRIPAGATPADVLQQLVRGRVIQYAFTIIDGWTFSQLRSALEADPRIENTLIRLDDSDIMERLGHPDRYAEGWFFPETYNFTRGATDEQILRRALRAMEDRLQAVWQERADDLPLEDPYEALILASIIERETGQASERAAVSGVFIRRLQRGMRLQTDPTVIYGMGDAYDGRIRTRDLRTDTPYNTYTRHGLPPTPIAMPGRAALEAAVNPDDGTTLYFVSRGDGSHHFSNTYEEHRRAVRRYILREGE